MEYGGYIYKNSDGTYGYTTPLPGTEAGFDLSSANHLVPKDSIIVGAYHTHADYSVYDPADPTKIIRTSDPTLDDFNSDHFSQQDLRVFTYQAGTNSNYRGYLGTPNGTFRAFNPTNGKNGKQYIIK